MKTYQHPSCHAPALSTTFRTRDGMVHSLTVSPASTLADLYKSVMASPQEQPIVQIDFADIGSEYLKGRSHCSLDEPLPPPAR